MLGALLLLAARIRHIPFVLALELGLSDLARRGGGKGVEAVVRDT